MTTSGKHRAFPPDKLRAWWNRPDEPLQSRPLSEHLAALRKTLIICILAIAAAFFTVFLLWAQELVDFVTEPLTNRNIRVIFSGVAEAFAAQTKLSLIVGCVAASPVVLLSVWLYVRPALHRKEQVLSVAVLTAAIALFALGVYFAYQYVFFLAVNFFVSSGEAVAEPMIALGTYVNFLFSFLIPFGVMFELPLLIIGLTKLELVTTAALRRGRKFVIFGIFAVAAILTPPDVISQVMLGVPMCVLYEVGVFCSWLFAPRRRKKRTVGSGQAMVGV